MAFQAGAVTGKLTFDANQALAQFGRVQAGLRQIPAASGTAQMGLSALETMAFRAGGALGQLGSVAARTLTTQLSAAGGAATGASAAIGSAAGAAGMLAARSSATGAALAGWTSSATAAGAATAAAGAAAGAAGLSLSTLIPIVGGVVAGLYGLYKVLQLIQRAVPLAFQQFVSLIRRGTERIDEMRAAATELAASLATAFPTARFQELLETSDQIVKHAQMMDAAYVGTGRELITMVRALGQYGMAQEMVLKMQTQAGRDQIVAFANMLRMMTGARDEGMAMMQIQQELRALAEGRAAAGATLVRRLRQQHGISADTLRTWIAQGKLMDEVMKLFPGYEKALGSIENLWSTIKSTTQTIVDRILMKATEKIYPEMVEYQKRLNALLQEENGELSEIGRYLVATIQVAWENIKVAAAGVLDVVQTIWPHLTNWEDVLQAVAEWAWRIQLYFRLAFVVMQQNVKMAAALNQVIKAGVQRDLPAMMKAMRTAFAIPGDMWKGIGAIRAELKAGLPEIKALEGAMGDLGTATRRSTDDSAKRTKKTADDLDKIEGERIQKWLEWIDARKVAEAKSAEWEIAKLKEVVGAHKDWYDRHPLELTKMWGTIRRLREDVLEEERRAADEERATIEAGFNAKMADIRWWAEISGEAIPATIAQLQELYAEYAEWPDLAQATARAIAEAQKRQAEAEKRWAEARKREAIEARQRELDAIELDIQLTGDGHQRKVAWLRREITLTEDLAKKRQLYVEITATEREWLEAQLAGTMALQERLEIVKALIPRLTSTTAILEAQNEQRRIENELVKVGVAELDRWADALDRRFYSEQQLLALHRFGIERTIAAYADLGITAGAELDDLRDRLRDVNAALDEQAFTLRNVLAEAWQPVTAGMSDLFYGLMERAGGALKSWNDLWLEFRLVVVRTFQRIVADTIAGGIMEKLGGLLRSAMGLQVRQLGMAAATHQGTLAMAAQIPVVAALTAAYFLLAAAIKAAGPIGGILGPPIGEIFQPMQAGGLVTQPTLAMLGEKGPELVMPLKQGQEVAAAPTGDVNITIQAIDTQSGLGFLLRNRRAVGDAIMAAARDNHPTKRRRG